MNKAPIFLTYLLLVFLLTSCQKKEDTTTISEVTSTEATEKASNLETTTHEVQEEVEDPVKEEDFAIEVDPTLTGIKLIKAAKIVNPIPAISYDIKNSMGLGDYSYEIVGTMIKVGENYIKTVGSPDLSEGRMVTLYNADEKMTYQYFEATLTGYKYEDDLMTGTGPAIEGEYDLTTLYAEDSNLMKAEVIDYEGEPVMYFEIKEAGNKVASWVSLKYGITIKTDMYEGDKVVGSMTVSNIKLPDNLDDAFFMPPSNVLFEDYSQGSKQPLEEVQVSE